MSQASFVVYIDESGDEGLNCAGNASSWFVLSATITRKSRDLETVKVVDTVRELLKRPLKKPLHFRDLRHEHRLPFVSLLAQKPTTCALSACCYCLWILQGRGAHPLRSYGGSLCQDVEADRLPQPRPLRRLRRKDLAARSAWAICPVLAK